VRPGRFRVTMLYTCAEENLGARFRVEINGASITGKVTEAHTPGPLPYRNRKPRPDWGVFKDWAELELGTIELKKGDGPLTLEALEIPGEKMPDIKAIRLTPVD